MSRLFVVDKYPAEYASGVYINDVVWAQFSLPIASGTATYYNFTVNTKNTYEPVDGVVEVHGVSGGLNDAVIVFIPTNGFVRNTEYSVLVSTGITSKNAPQINLADDTVWYFTTGNTAASGTIGDSVYDLDPSGFTEDDSAVGTSGDLNPSGAPLEVMETTPADYDSNVSTTLPYIGIRFNGIIPSGVDLYGHITLSSKRVLG